jgi:uncharacterized peroxidase-related enzyme
LIERERPGVVAAMLDDFRAAALSAREQALCTYAEKLTRAPWEMTRADLLPLRAAGLSDRDILDVNLICAYFAYANRLALGLGVALEGGEELLGW